MSKIILLVDDDQAILDGLKFAFEAQGFTIETAPNGSAAMDIVMSKQVDLIFLDLRMPGIDGGETCKLIRTLNSYKDTPIIAYTAYDFTFSQKQKQVSTLFTEILQKPSDIETIINTANKYLGIIK